jgi:hypothetical protein
MHKSFNFSLKVYQIAKGTPLDNGNLQTPPPTPPPSESKAVNERGLPELTIRQVQAKLVM